MKSIKSLLAMYTGLSVMSTCQHSRNNGSYCHGIPDKPRKIIPKGCKEYTYRGITVTALSEERAIAKINKKLKAKNQ